MIDDWQVAKETSFFAGESEAGKTFLAIDVAMRTCLGWPVFGRRTKPGLVIYQIGESGDSLIDLRIPAWVHHFGADLPERVPFEILPAKVNLWTSETGAKDGAVALLATIRGIMADYPGLPLVALYIDTWSKAFAGGDEINGKDVAKVIANAEMIARETGAHVAIIHHFPKGGTTLRGHSSLKADVNAVAMVSMDRETKVRTVRFDKLKDGEKGEMQFELKQIRLGEREDGKPITSCIVLPVGAKEKMRAEQGRVRLMRQEPNVFAAFWKALDEFGEPAPSSLDCPFGTRVVDFDEVKRIYVEMTPDEAMGQARSDADQDAAHRNHVDKLMKRCLRATNDMAQKVGVLAIRMRETEGTKRKRYWVWWTGKSVKDFQRTYPPESKQEAPPEALAEIADMTGIAF